MNILFVIDRLELKYFEFNNLVTNFWLIKEFLERKNNVFITTIDNLSLKSNIAYAKGFYAYKNDGNIFYDKAKKFDVKVEDFELVMFRPDPPVDLDYINATYIFDFVNRDKTTIINDPKAIRDFNEKLHSAYFSDLMPNYTVTSSKSDIMNFLRENDEIILKPLNKCFGSGVMYLKYGDKNTAVIIDTMTNHGTNLLMVQKYIPSAVYGDKRVLIVGNKVYDYCVRKLPSNDDFKFCEHNDDCVKKDNLTDSERVKFSELAKQLNEKGIFMAGLDVIDEKIIEINVTSPCYFIKEINNGFGISFEKTIADDILALINKKSLCS